MIPNNFAYLVMAIWPFVTFLLMRKYGIGKGALLALLTSYMFLPARMSIEISGLPDLDRFLITILTIIVYMLFSGSLSSLNLLSRVYKVLLFILVLSPIFTALSNQERYLFLPGLTLYDGISSSITTLLNFFPFFIGATYFREENQQIYLFKTFAIATFVYAFLALYEIRMSPQLHSMIYGYFPHAWGQQYRDGGFRAVVFMGHGLLVAMFLALGVTVWTCMFKLKVKVFRFKTGSGLLVVFLTLLLSKSLAALLYGLLAFVAIKFFSPRKINLVSVLIAIVFVTYPILSATKIFPHQDLVELAASVSADRAGSLQYRFDNEHILLEHANEKPWFGWGDWGRNRVFDPETGQDISTTDGAWIISIGVSGWIGFLSTFLFMIIPIWLIFTKDKRIKSMPIQSQYLISAHSLIVGLIIMDQMPNASINPLYWCVIGSLAGRVHDVISTKYSINKVENSGKHAM